MIQESGKLKSRMRLRATNRFKFSGHLSKALNIMKSAFSFLKTTYLGVFANQSLTLSQTLLQSSILIGLALGYFHV